MDFFTLIFDRIIFKTLKKADVCLKSIFMTSLNAKFIFYDIFFFFFFFFFFGASDMIKFQPVPEKTNNLGSDQV